MEFDPDEMRPKLAALIDLTLKSFSPAEAMIALMTAAYHISKQFGGLSFADAYALVLFTVPKEGGKT